MIKSRKLAVTVTVALAAATGMGIAATTAHASTPAPVASASVTPQNIGGIYVRPQAYNNGLCLTAASAAAGTRITEGDCGHTHEWSYYDNGQLSLQGHPETGLGDSGGVPVLKATPTTTVDSDATVTGGNGFTYYELDLGGAGNRLYLHSNGNGGLITIDGQKGNLANYYAMQALAS